MNTTQIAKYMGRTIEIFPRDSKGIHPVTIDGKHVALRLLKASWYDSLWMARNMINNQITTKYEKSISHDYGFEDWEETKFLR